MGLINWNIRYVKALNSCDRKSLMAFFRELLTSDLKDAFVRKRYIWNLIRGKGFYKDLSFFVITLAQEVLDGTAEDPDMNMSLAEKVVKEVIASEKRYDVRKSFIWQITKNVPFLTVDILPYVSHERVTNMLDGKRVIHDEALSPLIGTIINLRQQNDSLTKQMDDLVDAFSHEDV